MCLIQSRAVVFKAIPHPTEMRLLEYKECVILGRTGCSTLALGGCSVKQAVWSLGPDGVPPWIQAFCGRLVMECWEELPVLEFAMWCQDSFREHGVSRCIGTVQNFLKSNGSNIGLDFAVLAASLAWELLGPAD